MDSGKFEQLEKALITKHVVVGRQRINIRKKPQATIFPCDNML